MVCGPRFESDERVPHSNVLTETKRSQAAGGVTPLEVFAKHARLAPAILQQKAEEVLPRAPTPLSLP